MIANFFEYSYECVIFEHKKNLIDSNWTETEAIW